MMTTTVKLSPTLATTIALVYQTINTAVEYGRAVSTDPACPYLVKNTMSLVIGNLRTAAETIEKRIPAARRAEFTQQYKDTDLLRLENIKRLYMKLKPEDQDVLELMIEQLSKGETIQIEHVNQ
jgi:hypothetical protein